ncbi:MAG: hypothetical protein CMJ59_01695 [Planctomycetaceae bacterium]|nr:hypothetical protein [Planctomycetaceae bacterium]
MLITQLPINPSRFPNRTRLALALVGILCVWSVQPSCGAPAVTQAEARKALKRAVFFFRSRVSIRGGYLWRYSADLKQREGEDRTGPHTAWVQPPGTPTVGQAYLRAYHLTDEPYLLAAALETGNALVDGQLQSGGWDYRIEFDSQARSQFAYRTDGEARDKRNVTTLDDNTTQAALQFLMTLDQTLMFQNSDIHARALFALEQLLRAQFPLGAWPQRYDRFPDPADFPSHTASYPPTWSRQYPRLDYRNYYTFNDNTIADMITTMFLAARIYDDPRFREAAERAGDFIIAAQMPDPQPAWAQQYNVDMHPAWARKFEPPAVTGGESQGVMRTLLLLFRHTGKRKYLHPIPEALAYLKRSQLENGQLARFYELRTNRPLYFNRNYELTYDDSDLPTHYGFKIASQLDSIQQEYEQLLATKTAEQPITLTTPSIRLTEQLTAAASEVISNLNKDAAWVKSGRLKYQEQESPTEPIIDVPTFIRNVDVLSRFLRAKRK